MSDRRPEPLPPKVVALAAQIRVHGPDVGCEHVWDALCAIDAKFPGLSFREFVLAIAVANAEGQA
jgi:hypothetical protein